MKGANTFDYDCLMEFGNYHSMLFPSIYKVKITSIK